ncbi:fused acetyl/propionyl-CoA carboxylase subuit alpha/methylmalonyl-CoA decarboxylase subunit alpha [Amycolatopsis orientalis]|uniref:biotin carboxylase n=1 Tax=Amycolatopsis orientalis TaxID=31958 RepID=A0A193BUI1_AMYOR|nr:carboxyl transferase domain-containing protein [Amycolatopsis orientalis]ANN15872.1 fused acetyl/propionyl-CoA carboxylase subuit alpha/methylmalonyl-CoA decarboxylase subunit alpha [Amycolatopsis orientalis]
MSDQGLSFGRVAIVNRGEAAMRFLNAARDLVAETGALIETVALYTDVDRDAQFVREADMAHYLGPAAAKPYLDLSVLERALVTTRADAAWVGWGFVAEDPLFAELCDRLGVTFIGPSAAAMRGLGDKIGAKQVAEAAGVPVAPWSRGAVPDLGSAVRMADEIGYPLMLKATAGGGGRGIRMVADRAELVECYERTRIEARHAFGHGDVFLERLVTGARHVEVQVIADGQGNAWALGVRDCSIQRRNQKIIEESACPLLSPEQENELKAAAERLVLAVDYQGVGTVEFLYQPQDRTFAFLEVNTRLQVEHTITEVTTGFDLVRAQLRVALGGTLAGDPPPAVGHAIEARLNAEDPDRDFLPAPGRVARFTVPTGFGVRVDTGVAEGDSIPADFDSMIAKIIAYGRDRDEALGRLRRAVAGTTVVIEGGATNKSFVLDLLDRPEVIKASADTGWVDRVRAAGQLRDDRHRGVALLAAAVDTAEALEAQDRLRFLESARGGRPREHQEACRPMDFTLRGVSYRARVARTAHHRHLVRLETGTEVLTAEVELKRFDRHTGSLRVNGHKFRFVMHAHRSVHLVEVDDIAHRISRDDGGMVRAPSSALVVATPAAPGAEVEAGAALIVLESMKMENVLRAPFPARVRECLAEVGGQVETGTPLMRLEPLTGPGPATVEPGPDLAGLELPPAPVHGTLSARMAAALGDLRSVLLGFDVDDSQRRTALAEYLAVRPELAATGQYPVERETALLKIFGDISALNSDSCDSPFEAASTAHSPREQFHRFLQTLDVEKADVPSTFRQRLTEVLGHYGIDTPQRTNALEDAIFRISVAARRATEPVAVAILRQWLVTPPPSGPAAEAALPVLARISTVTRSPEVRDLAGSVRFRWSVRPAVREKRLLVQRLLESDSDPAPVLEALSRCHDERLPERAQVHRSTDGTFVVVADQGRRLVTAHTSFAKLRHAVTTISEKVPEGPCDVDIYLRWPGEPEDDDVVAAELRETLAPPLEANRLSRITVILVGHNGDHHRVFTFRPPSTLEDRHLRGIHPDAADRLGWDRLREFDLTPLRPRDDAVVVVRCVAPEDSADTWLLAAAQASIALPGLDHVVALCLDEIRSARRSCAPPKTVTRGDRIFIHLRPPVGLTVAELHAAGERIRGTTIATGLEEIVVDLRTKAEPTGSRLRIVFDGLSSRVLVEERLAEPVRRLDDYRQQVLRARAAGAAHPYEVVDLLTGPGGTFVEHDLDEAGSLVPVDRPRGRNSAAVVAGVVSVPTERHPEGLTRVALFGDPTKSLGALSEQECARVIGALDLAERRRIPLEWFSVSAGVRISMTSGTENLDWAAAVLKRIVEFTQRGGEINVVVAGVNVGAQPYWNAEATMLMHTKGVLVMTPSSTMVLTGKKALDFSGGVSAENNLGIGGHDRVMGPNGQAQYWAPDLAAACAILMAHYAHTYVAPGESTARATVTADPHDRDISRFPHSSASSRFSTVGEIFSAEANGDRKSPFDIRAVMRAVTDQDHPVLERWAGMADAETAVVQDAHVGGLPVCLIGVESHSVARRGRPPADGPDTFTSGTLFPLSSKKVARAINAASGNRPLVIMANLSGFDGSPESLRRLQLEYGAEIGRAIVNFTGPIVLCVLSRYHGGAFVVFSKSLNPNMTVLAVEGAFASVIGGAPAAAVVFDSEVRRRTANDPRVRAAADREAASSAVQAEIRAEVAAEFNRVHSIQRAVDVGSVDAIVSVAEVRPRIIKAITEPR